MITRSARHDERARVVERHGAHQPHERLPRRPARVLDRRARRVAAVVARSSSASRPTGSGHRYGSAATNATKPMARHPATGASHRATPRAVRARRPAGSRRASATASRRRSPVRRRRTGTCSRRPCPNATAAATSHAPRRRPGSRVRHARVAHTTESSARNAGTASSITWLVYLMVQVWTARNSPPIGETSASRTADRDAEHGVREPRDGQLWLGEVVRRAGGGRAVGISGAGGRGASAMPVTIFASGGCSVR